MANLSTINAGQTVKTSDLDEDGVVQLRHYFQLYNLLKVSKQ